jgi:hypothetical protein
MRLLDMSEVKEPMLPAALDAGEPGEVYRGLDAMIPLAEIGIELPLAEIFEAVDFIPEPREGE